MQSTITCEYALPFSGQLDGLEKTPDWSQIEFQTESLPYSFENFTISEDGYLYRDTYELIEVPQNERKENNLPDIPILKREENGIEKMDYTGEIDFFGFLMDKKSDYWIEFKALFWKGDLKELTLENLEEKDNSRRFEAQEKIREELKSINEKRKKWWHKYKLSIWYGRAIRVSFFLFKWLFALIIQCLSWVIRRLQGLEMWLLGVK